MNELGAMDAAARNVGKEVMQGRALGKWSMFGKEALLFRFAMGAFLRLLSIIMG